MAATLSGVSIPPGNLTDLSMVVLRHVSELTPESVDARGKIEDSFRDFEARALRNGYSSAQVQTAKYALAALVDEHILLSDLPMKDEWLGRPLQMLYFDDFSAGEEFYNKLDAAMLDKSLAGADVKEVFHLCLAFGFKGKYGDVKGTDRRRILMESIVQDVNHTRQVRADVPLSPRSEVQDALAVPTKSLSFLGKGPIWLVPLTTLVVVVACYVLFMAITDMSLNHFTASVQSISGSP